MPYYLMTDEDGGYFGTLAEFPTLDDFQRTLEHEGIVGDVMGAGPFNSDDLKPIYARWCIGASCGGFFDNHFHVKEGPGRGHWKGWEYRTS